MQRGLRNLAIDTQPDEAFSKLVQRKQAWQRGKEQFSAMLHLRYCGHADGPENGTAGKVGGR